MVSVEFKSVGAGTCAWCQKQKDEVFDVAFGDKSFVGMYCRGDLMKAVSVKCEKRGKTVGQSHGTATTTDGKTVATNTVTTEQMPKAAQPVGQTNGSGFGGPGVSSTEGKPASAAK